MRNLNHFVVIVFLSVNAVSTFEVVDNACSCKDVDIVSNKDVVLRKHGDILGRYTRIDGPLTGGSSTPSYVHTSGKYFLYYSTQSQGFWAVGETLGGEIVRLENQGDDACPYFLKSIWRYADGELNSLVYDISLKVACMSDPCSVAHCGHKSKCVISYGQNSTLDSSSSPTASCECEENFEGDPYDRCYPLASTNAVDCDCRRLIFSTYNPLAASKHSNSYGEYFLYDVVNGTPIYQHFAGIEYLYERGGHWLISDKVGLQEAGLQNQGDAQGPTCPYLLRSAWEYADVDQPGWQWVYDYTANLMCPKDPCSVNKCGHHATCVVDGARHRILCACDSGYEGDPYDRCYPQAPSTCGCKVLEMSSVGQSALAQADKMGTYYLYGFYNRRPAYQHQSGLDYLYYADGDAWVVGATFGGPRVGIVNFERARCPYAVTPGSWRHSVNGKLERDSGIVLKCVDPSAPVKDDEEVDSGSQTNPEETDSIASEVNSSPDQTLASTQQIVETSEISTVRPTKIEDLTLQRHQLSSELHSSDMLSEGSTSHEVTVVETTLCDCPEIEIASQNKMTVEKHGAQLGRYRLIRVQGGRPIYQHIESGTQFLYYHPYSGGNWLINSEVGLLYGGIQNSQDSPLCPYLINTMWQYGDGDLHGWVYDPTLKVTCPTDPCSVLRCGFRADCVRDRANSSSTQCQCQPGFSGNPYERCYPDDPLLPCACKRLQLTSSGPAAEHQRDKLGQYFLWGKSNNRPVYQHESGLDFMYYHSNNVWGVGPKVGGNSAGLLNFGRQPCPYDLITPWEFGTRNLNGKRQSDQQLKLICLDNKDEPDSILKNAPTPLKAGIDLVNNAISFVASIGNKLSPQSQTQSHGQAGKNQPASLEEPPVHEVPSNVCGWTTYGKDGSRSFGIHPWYASVNVVQGDLTKQACVGVIAGPKHIITTATCVTSYPIRSYRIVIGGVVPDRREEFSVQSIITHDEFSDKEGQNDIAVVTLKQKIDSDEGKFITFDGLIRPLCLPERNASHFFDYCEIMPSEVSSLGFETELAQCETPNDDQSLICVDSHVRSTSPLVCRDSRINLAVLAGLPTKNCGLDCAKTPSFIQTESFVNWIKKRLKL